jgi:hypothetical protein
MFPLFSILTPRSTLAPASGCAITLTFAIEIQKTMLNWFKKKTPQSAPTSASSGMSDNLAQAVVYAFIDRMAAGAPFVGDARTLPYPKDTIRAAFIKHLEHYEGMRRISEELFRSKGYDETVHQLRTMFMRLDDWHDIDHEDRDAVARMNAVQGPPPEWAMPIIGKYMQRSLDK